MTNHPDGDQIEAYAMAVVQGYLDEQEALIIEIEDHLLWCHACLENVMREERIVAAVRSAALSTRSEIHRPKKKLATVRMAGGGNP